MRNVLLAFVLLSMVSMVGCAWLDKVAPPKYDDQGQEIPFSREPTEFTKVVAHNVPYGDVALYGILFIAGVWQKFKRTKVENGLKATVLAVKKTSEDPETQAAWEKFKDYLREAHNDAGVTSLIKLFMAKLPSTGK